MKTPAKQKENENENEKEQVPEKEPKKESESKKEQKKEPEKEAPLAKGEPELAGSSPKTPSGEETPPPAGSAPSQETGSNEEPQAQAKPGESRGHSAQTHVAGDHNKTTINFGTFVQDDGAHGKRKLIDCLTDLPLLQLTDATSAAFPEAELNAKVEVLRGERLLFLSCSDADLQFSAACALVDTLTTPQLVRKLLHFGRVAGVEFPIIGELLGRRIEPDKEVVVVVDATDDLAEPFVGPLFKVNSLGYRSIRSDLHNNSLYIICLIKPEALTHCPANDRNEPLFANWSVSQLQYVLRRHFPDDYLELERSVLEQRRKGGWSSDDGEFRRQITALIEQGELRTVVDRGGITIPDQATNFPENALHVAVLYTATFFPSLSPYEFRRVLSAVVGDEKMLVPRTVRQKTKDGTFKEVSLQHEEPVASVWLEQANKALIECRVITSDEAKRGITFADIGRRDHLRKHFDKQYGLYVQSRFLVAYEKQLLFDQAEQIAKDVILLTLDMARSYPDHFGVDWLYDLIVSAQQHSNGPERTADLLRAFLRERDLDVIVGRTMKRLFDGARHAEIYEICEKLRFTPGIDVLPMIRRLMDEGKGEVSNKAMRYLARELEQPGRIYPMLRLLESWLPDRETEPARYSCSAAVALRYVFLHCLEATGEFNIRDRGTWPTSFSLLAVGSDSARDHFALLLRWLLHPQLQFFVRELPDRFHRYLPALIAEWSFFLFGEPAGGRDEERDSRALTADSLTAEDAWKLLVERLVELTATDRERQESLLFEWETMRTVFALMPSIVTTQREREIRREFAWKRNLVRKLIGEFRRLQRKLRPPSSQRARATA